MSDNIIKTPDGKAVRVTQMDMKSMVKEKLTDNDLLEKFDAEVNVYRLQDKSVVEKYQMPYKDGLEFMKKVKSEHPELGVQIVQIVE